MSDAREHNREQKSKLLYIKALSKRLLKEALKGLIEKRVVIVIL